MIIFLLFQVQVNNVSRLCHAKPIVTVNGRFPGPTIYVREGDSVQINVTNHAQYNMSIHWYCFYVSILFYYFLKCTCALSLSMLLIRRSWCLFSVRHGLKQFRNGWADGPAYVTQCPIQTGSSFLYSFNVTGQRGTLWWHAHILWLRATVYGAIVIMPKPGTPFPFQRPAREEILVFGEFRLIKMSLVGTYKSAII